MEHNLVIMTMECHLSRKQTQDVHEVTRKSKRNNGIEKRQDNKLSSHASVEVTKMASNTERQAYRTLTA